jgi:hypothetical protein
MKTRQNKNLEPGSDSIRTGNALAADTGVGAQFVMWAVCSEWLNMAFREAWMSAGVFAV